MSLLAWIYFGLLFLWLGLQFLFRDSLWWLGIINSLSLYCFLPLLIFLIFALYEKSIGLIVISLIALAVLCVRHGWVCFPRIPRRINDNNTCLRIMTYNLLQSNQNINGVLDSLLNAEADIIALQEMNEQIESELKCRLHPFYPYQVSGGKKDISKIAWNGILSKYSLKEINSEIHGEWAALPQVCEVDFRGRSIYLINVHAYPHRIGTAKISEIAISHRLREEANRELLSFIRMNDKPIIVTGDFNATDQNYAYKIVCSQLKDAWREAGWGLGNTFGLRLDTFSNKRLPPLFLSFLPKWLLRIDYIFISKEWTVTKAQIGKWDGYSDHRPLIVELVMEDGKSRS